jgi:hypothetical protein
MSYKGLGRAGRKGIRRLDVPMDDCAPQIMRSPAFSSSMSRCNPLESIFVMKASQNGPRHDSVITRNSVA